ncbi:MAG: M20 family metallopeptidase [Clostridiales bacterium]|nr:M20 family metallopeptidase [Clostridiales bacterium]
MKEKERLNQIVENLSPELIKLAKDIHANPELGFQEFKAYQWQVDLIKKYGFEVEEHVSGMETAYIASYKGDKPGPVVGMISEYDALPGLGHGCGHNLICMIGVGAGLAMKEFVDKYGGEVRIYGTPAEESDGGKLPMLADGRFDDVDACLEVHPSCMSTDGWGSSALYACRVEFFGKPSHAAAAPEIGINALDAMILLFNAVGLMRQQTKEDIRIHGVITDGGVVPGIIPDYTKAEFYARSYRAKDSEDILNRIKAASEGAALATGCRTEVTFYDGAYMDTVTNQPLSRRAADYSEELGYKVKRFNGQHTQGASDLGNVSYRIPCVQLMCKLGDSPDGSDFGLHTHYLLERAGSDEGIAVGLDYVKILAATAIDVLTEPELLAEIKEAHKYVND